MAEIVNGNPINETHANVKRSRSTFPLKQTILDTHRFGEYHPIFVLDGVTSDKLPIRSAHVARSYTLKAPLMQDIKMHKDFFLVPLRAILPFQADRIVTNPTMGDDVPSDAYTNVSDFVSKIDLINQSFCSSLTALSSASPFVPTTFWTLYLKYFVFMESIFSSGSLLSSLGCNLSSYCLSYRSDNDTSVSIDIDHCFDYIFLNFINSVRARSDGFSVTIDSVSYRVICDGSSPESSFSANAISPREFLMRIRDTSDWSITSFPSGYSNNVWNTSNGRYFVLSYSGFDTDLDLARLWAYHICCASFYSDDKIDYIYSADLFRQYIDSLFHQLYSSAYGSNSVFSWNGLKLSYDFLSAHWFDKLANAASSLSSLSSIDFIAVFQYFFTLFGYHRSLRYKDYFTGSRTRPLAVGAASGPNSTNVPVVSNQVSVVDISRSIQVQRFLNSVNATGRKFEEYLKGIFGVAPSPDHHNPLFLAHSTDTIFASEVENTGDAQWDSSSDTGRNSVTAIFRGNGNQFEYSVEVDEPSIIIGIVSYDIERAYIGGMERSFLTKDRFDMFLPQLQYVGDQDIKASELFAPASYPYHDIDNQKYQKQEQKAQKL